MRVQRGGDLLKVIQLASQDPKQDHFLPNPVTVEWQTFTGNWVHRYYTRDIESVADSLADIMGQETGNKPNITRSLTLLRYGLDVSAPPSPAQVNIHWVKLCLLLWGLASRQVYKLSSPHPLQHNHTLDLYWESRAITAFDFKLLWLWVFISLLVRSVWCILIGYYIQKNMLFSVALKVWSIWADT